MKKALYSVALLSNIVACELSAQQSVVLDFQKCYGGSELENQGVSTMRQPLIHTKDGGLFFAASTQSDDGDVTERHIPLVDGDDTWAVKLNSAGAIEWEKSLGANGTDFPTSAVQTLDGGFIISAHTSSDKGGNITLSGVGGNDLDAWIVKLNALGEIGWERRIGGTESDVIYSIIQTKDSGYIAVGVTESHDEQWLGESWISNHGSSDVFVIKLDATGKTEWLRFYGGEKGDGGRTTIIEVDNGYIFAALTTSLDSNVLGIHRWLGNPNFAAPDVWVVRLDLEGNIAWQKCYGGSDNDQPHAIIHSGKGGYVIGANTISVDGDVSGFHGTERNKYDVWLCEIDSAGSIMWEKCFGGNGSEGINSLIRTHDGGYAFLGDATMSDGDVPALHSDGQDIWAAGISGSGELKWSHCFGGTEKDYGNSIVELSENNFALHGTTNSNDGDVSGNKGRSDVWIAKFHIEQSSVEAGRNATGFAYPFPTPSVDEVRFVLPPYTIQRISFVDILGKDCYPKYTIESLNVIVDLTSIPEGVYHMTIYYEEKQMKETRKFIKSAVAK